MKLFHTIYVQYTCVHILNANDMIICHRFLSSCRDLQPSKHRRIHDMPVRRLSTESNWPLVVPLAWLLRRSMSNRDQHLVWSAYRQYYVVIECIWRLLNWHSFVPRPSAWGIRKIDWFFRIGSSDKPSLNTEWSVERRLGSTKNELAAIRPCFWCVPRLLEEKKREGF